MKTGNNSVQFTPQFFQTQTALQHAQEPEDTAPISYSPEKYGTWDAFEQHADYAIAQRQYQQLFSDIDAFVAQHCPHPEPIQGAFTNFRLQLEEGAFIPHLPLLYGEGKSAFDTFYGLLSNESLPLGRKAKTAALKNLANKLHAGADDAINNLVLLVQQLQRTLLEQAGKEKNEQILKNLLLAGMPPEIRDDKGNTPLMYAAREGWLDTIDQLIQQNIEIDATNPINKTALMFAAKHGHIRVIEKLFALGANASLTSITGRNALAYAVIAGHVPVVEYLLTARQEQSSRYTSPNGQPNTWFDINATDIDGRTPFIWLFQDEKPYRERTPADHKEAFMDNMVRSAFPFMFPRPKQSPEAIQQILNLLIEHGANINIRARDNRRFNNDEWSILEKEGAFTSGCFDLLLDAGLQLPLEDERMCGAILLNTIQHGTLAQLQRLIQLKLPTYYPSAPEFESPIKRAIQHGKFGMALLLLSRHQADISLRTRASLLYKLAGEEDPSSPESQKVLELLLDPVYLRKPDPVREAAGPFLNEYLRVIDDPYLEPHLFPYPNKKTLAKACQILIQYNVVSLPTKNGDTLLMHLVKKAPKKRFDSFGYGTYILSMIRYLATHTDLLFVQDRDGFTPFAVACLSGDIKTIETLYQANPTLIGIRDARGNTPLMLAANSQQPEVINWLLEKQPDLNASNNDGYTAFMLARMRGDQARASIEALRNAGADTQEAAEAMSQ